MHRCVGGDFRCLISLPTLRELLATTHALDNVGVQPVMMSSRYLQAKSCTTTLSPSVTVSSDVAGRVLLLSASPE
jgi:hypothetical protein